MACSTNALPTLLALLNHENSDIAADAVEVLSELTDADAVEDAVGAAGVPWRQHSVSVAMHQCECAA